MNDFAVFFSSILNSFANFIWLDGTKYITACLLCLCVLGIVKRLLNMSDF